MFLFAKSNWNIYMFELPSVLNCSFERGLPQIHLLQSITQFYSFSICSCTSNHYACHKSSCIFSIDFYICLSTRLSVRHLSVCSSVRPSIRPSVRPSVRLSVCLSFYLSVKSINLFTIHPLIYRFICPSIHPFIHLFINSFSYLSIRQFIHPSIHQSIRQSIHPSIHISIHPSIQPSIQPSIEPITNP